MNMQLKEILIEAINEKRTKDIKEHCSPIWNMPFFFDIGEAKVLTISYSPSDKGIVRGYNDIYNQYKSNPDSFSAQKIYDFLYGYQDPKWRRNYNKIFTALGIIEKEIAHLDMSSFPYIDENYRLKYKKEDNTYKYTLRTIKLLENQLNYILIDGKNNKAAMSEFFDSDFEFEDRTILTVNRKVYKNGKKNEAEILIYKHKIRNMFLVYSGAFLYGETRPSADFVDNIIGFIKKNT